MSCSTCQHSGIPVHPHLNLAFMFGPKSEKNDVPVDKSQPNDEDDNQVYPSGVKLGLITASIYIAMFLVALVCVSPTLYSISGTDHNTLCRTSSSSQQPSLRLPTNSMQQTILVGTVLHTCYVTPPSYLSLARSIRSSTSKLSSLALLCSSKLVPPSVVHLRTRSLLS